jgi:hypothetical protein
MWHVNRAAAVYEACRRDILREPRADHGVTAAQVARSRSRVSAW